MTAEAIINVLLDTIKEHHQLRSEYALARHLEISDTQLVRLRKGEVARSTRRLLPLLVQYPVTIHPTPA